MIRAGTGHEKKIKNQVCYVPTVSTVCFTRASTISRFPLQVFLVVFGDILVGSEADHSGILNELFPNVSPGMCYWWDAGYEASVILVTMTLVRDWANYEVCEH